MRNTNYSQKEANFVGISKDDLIKTEEDFSPETFNSRSLAIPHGKHILKKKILRPASQTRFMTVNQSRLNTMQNQAEET